MRNTLGVMITCTTYGMWLRGDRRGWVDDGKILPANPALEDADRGQLKDSPWTFTAPQIIAAGALICASLQQRMGIPVWALAVESWHLHAVVDPKNHDVGKIAKCIKDAVRYGLKPGRPIWAAGYDKRWCFDDEALRRRIDYVERHSVRSEEEKGTVPFFIPGPAVGRWDALPDLNLAPGQCEIIHAVA